MTFAQMEQEFGKIAESKGYVTKDVIAAKENELRAYVDKGISPVLLTAQELQLRHFQEFGEILPGSELLEKAAQAGAGNFKEYYEQSIAGPRRIAADKAKYESELKTQRETYERQLQETKDQAEAEKQRLIGMNATNNPADAGEGNQFRDYVQGIKKEEASKIPDIPIGEGGIAAEAARIYKQNGGHF